MLLTLVVFLVILTALVLIHEAGHYFVAKFFHIKVEEFGFGFPPRAFGIKRGETIYSINWLPIGGFVKLYGEDEAGGGRIQSSKIKVKSEGKDAERAFYAKPAWQRALVIFAGVVMNTILAIVLFYIFLGLSGFKTQVVLLGPAPHFIGAQTTLVPAGVIIDNVEKGSPADMAGIQAPSVVLSVNQQKITSSKQFTQVITSHRGKEITLSWENAVDGTMHTAAVTPRLHVPKNQGSLGVGLNDSPYAEAILDYTSPMEKVFSGVSHSWNMVVYTVSTFGGLINTSIKEHSFSPVGKNVSGPVGIFSIVGLILQIPSFRDLILQLLNLAGLLSISLAFFNVLPIPALDGGRLFFIIVEMLTRKKINPIVEGYINTAGMAVLLLLVLLVTIKDIGQFFHPF